MLLNWENHFIANIYGSCSSGKSYLLKYIIYTASHKKKIDHVLLFTNTSFNNQYDYIPEKYIHPAYDSEIIQNYMNLQRELIESGEESNGLIVFDDVLGQAQFNCKQFITLVSQFRQFKISIIICSQSVSQIPLHIRNLAQYAFIFRFEAERVIKACYESFGVLFDNWQEFKKYLLNATNEKHKFLFYDRMKSVDGIQASYKSLRAPKFPNFKLQF